MSRIWLMTSVRRRFSVPEMTRALAGTRERCTSVLAERRTMSKLVPISSGFSLRALTPCTLATFMAAASASSIKATSRDTHPFCMAMTRATPESAAEK